MSKRLKSKNIVVTAAGQGIGRATAIAFNNEGANVIATDINDQTLETLNKEYPNIKVKNLDSTNKKAVEEFSASLNQVDVLFNDAENFSIACLFVESKFLTLIFGYSLFKVSNV